MEKPPLRVGNVLFADGNASFMGGERAFYGWKRRCADVRAGTQAPPLPFLVWLHVPRCRKRLCRRTKTRKGRRKRLCRRTKSKMIAGRGSADGLKQEKVAGRGSADGQKRKRSPEEAPPMDKNKKRLPEEALPTDKIENDCRKRLRRWTKSKKVAGEQFADGLNRKRLPANSSPMD